MQDLSIYIHYPFCKSKCPYCDFNSHVKEKIDHESFKTAYRNEIEFFAKNLKNRKIKTIFFGGGTPSLMPIDLVEDILSNLAKNFLLDEACEITLEANPTSYESSKFQQLKQVGINRLSLGIQALNDEDLKFLGRTHSSAEAIGVIKNAANIFDNFSFDLIYARPEQKIENWLEELRRALSFGTQHLSLYQLTIEKGTRFFSDFAQKKFTMPSEELSADFFDATNKAMIDAGFEHYEISNYAKKNFECRHNLAYWQSDDYAGIGAGAHSRVFFDDDKTNRKAIMMIHEPQNWLESTLKKGNGVQKIDKINACELVEEIILMSLRLKKGLEISHFERITNKKFEQIFDKKKIQDLVNLGIIFFDGKTLKIPEEKRILTNLVIQKVLLCAV